MLKELIRRNDREYFARNVEQRERTILARLREGMSPLDHDGLGTMQYPTIGDTLTRYECFTSKTRHISTGDETVSVIETVTTVNDAVYIQTTRWEITDNTGTISGQNETHRELPFVCVGCPLNPLARLRASLYEADDEQEDTVMNGWYDVTVAYTRLVTVKPDQQDQFVDLDVIATEAAPVPPSRARFAAVVYIVAAVPRLIVRVFTGKGPGTWLRKINDAVEDTQPEVKRFEEDHPDAAAFMWFSHTGMTS